MGGWAGERAGQRAAGWTRGQVGAQKGDVYTDDNDNNTTNTDYMIKQLTK